MWLFYYADDCEEDASATNSTVTISPNFEHVHWQEEHDAVSVVTLLVMMHTDLPTVPNFLGFSRNSAT